MKGRLQDGGSLSHSFTREAREVGGGWKGEETGRERRPHCISFPRHQLEGSKTLISQN